MNHLFMLFFFVGVYVIAYIEGPVLLVDQGYAVIKPSGVGYQVFLCKKDSEALTVGQNVALYVHTHLREDALELYGFSSGLERQLFLLLISVSGVGPKLGLAILSYLRPNELIDAIINKDITTMSAVPGIGKKTAERLSLELKDKVTKLDCGEREINSFTSLRVSLEQAIRGLGFTKGQSDKAILALDHEDLTRLPLEVLIKKTLNVLGGNKS
jgi:Holliday junction DNA helicase RuvA